MNNNNRTNPIPDQLEKEEYNKILNYSHEDDVDTVYDLNILAEHEEWSIRGWWSNYWDDNDELRQSARNSGITSTETTQTHPAFTNQSDGLL